MLAFTQGDLLFVVIGGCGAGLCLAWCFFQVFEHIASKRRSTEGRRIANLGRQVPLGDLVGGLEDRTGVLWGCFRRRARDLLVVVPVDEGFHLSWRHGEQTIAELLVAREADARDWFAYLEELLGTGSLRLSVRPETDRNTIDIGVPLIRRQIHVRTSVGEGLILECHTGGNSWLWMRLLPGPEGQHLAEHLRSGCFGPPASFAPERVEGRPGPRADDQSSKVAARLRRISRTRLGVPTE